MTSANADDTDLRTNQVAALLGVSARTVERIPEAALPRWRTPGGHLRFARAEVVRYAREHLGREV